MKGWLNSDGNSISGSCLLFKVSKRLTLYGRPRSLKGEGKLLKIARSVTEGEAILTSMKPNVIPLATLEAVMSEAVKVALSAEEVLAQSERHIDDWMDDGSDLEVEDVAAARPFGDELVELVRVDGLKPGRQGLTGNGLRRRRRRRSEERQRGKLRGLLQRMRLRAFLFTLMIPPRV